MDLSKGSRHAGTIAVTHLKWLVDPAGSSDSRRALLDTLSSLLFLCSNGDLAAKLNPSNALRYRGFRWFFALIKCNEYDSEDLRVERSLSIQLYPAYFADVFYVYADRIRIHPTRMDTPLQGSCLIHVICRKQIDIWIHQVYNSPMSNALIVGDLIWIYILHCWTETFEYFHMPNPHYQWKKMKTHFANAPYIHISHFSFSSSFFLQCHLFQREAADALFSRVLNPMFDENQKLHGNEKHFLCRYDLARVCRPPFDKFFWWWHPSLPHKQHALSFSSSTSTTIDTHVIPETQKQTKTYSEKGREREREFPVSGIKSSTTNNNKNSK